MPKINKKNNAILKVIPNEQKLTDLNELLKYNKSITKKENKNGMVLGYIILTLGIMSLIASIIINELVDREYFSDSVIIFIVGVSLFSLLFGFYIVIKETR